MNDDWSVCGENLTLPIVFWIFSSLNVKMWKRRKNT